jgi:asparagine synthase (glutamine-hydrolysing)
MGGQAGGSQPAIVERMSEALHHRGPDGSGIWSEGDSGITLGHRRLAIIDLSPLAAQPMVSRCERFVLTFNGEVYNYRDLRAALEREGATFCGESDTEVLLAAVAQWGIVRALRAANGMLAMAVWDRRNRVLTLARDRLGKKPLYYGMAGGDFIFASELKALRTYPGFGARVDRSSVALYMRHGYIPAPHTIYEGVAKVPPASYVEVRADGIGEPTAYWSLAAEPGSGAIGDLEPGLATNELDRRLRLATRQRMVADVPLGAFLSGGIDSTTVVALMQAQSDRPIRTFSIGFAEREYNEAEDARLIASHLGTDHTELYVSSEQAQSVIPELPMIYDEPFGDSSQIPTCLLSKMTRDYVTVALSGDGGDESFAGYNRYFSGERIRSHRERIPRPLRVAAAAGLRSLPDKTWKRWVERANPILPHRLRSLRLDGKLTYAADLLDASRPESLYQVLVTHWGNTVMADPSVVPHATHFDRRSPSADKMDFVHRMMHLDTQTYLPDDILVKVDRATMQYSLEARAPLLDYEVVEYAWSLPLDLKVRDGKGKWLLRQVMNRYVPSALTERPKRGFAVPLDHWLRGPLRPWAESLLEEELIRDQGILNPLPIRQRWNEHVEGGRNHHHSLWIVLMFQAWLRANTA